MEGPLILKWGASAALHRAPVLEAADLARNPLRLGGRCLRLHPPWLTEVILVRSKPGSGSGSRSASSKAQAAPRLTVPVSPHETDLGALWRGKR